MCLKPLRKVGHGGGVPYTYICICMLTSLSAVSCIIAICYQESQTILSATIETLRVKDHESKVRKRELCRALAQTEKDIVPKAPCSFMVHTSTPRLWRGSTSLFSNHHRTKGASCFIRTKQGSQCLKSSSWIS